MQSEKVSVKKTLKKGKTFLAMMSLGMAVLVFALFGLNQTAFEAYGAASATSTYVTMSGHVTNESGKLVPNVQVSIATQVDVIDKKTHKHTLVWKTAGTALTDKKGYYYLSVKRPATDLVIVKWIRKGTTKPVIKHTFKIKRNSPGFSFSLKTNKSFTQLATLAFSY
ncbi:carboxypeptidase-like regulatory domain-containing protein [Paenibacillus glycinis]|uniref:Carboxypeptidase regulatory-like domain-containing protein n=1 Tax=Paenibacillus glycinis TaxID=2697035 RepID=A0ABW9Y172_9BACL|nr:carboxypeptidase-like regulatory domain-containing protein [Paenibacillus glycinis]NBD28211.1 hypothetical protein [Paenibacillus glycinis]